MRISPDLSDNDVGRLGDIQFQTITALSHSNEFFIQKAIGWALREYSKTDPQKVLNFVNTHPLKPLSQREALKVINRKKI